MAHTNSTLSLTPSERDRIFRAADFIIGLSRRECWAVLGVLIAQFAACGVEVGEVAATVTRQALRR